jgi:hypothetical protein
MLGRSQLIVLYNGGGGGTEVPMHRPFEATNTPVPHVGGGLTTHSSSSPPTHLLRLCLSVANVLVYNFYGPIPFSCGMVLYNVYSFAQCTPFKSTVPM